MFTVKSNILLLINSVLPRVAILQVVQFCSSHMSMLLDLDCLDRWRIPVSEGRSLLRSMHLMPHLPGSARFAEKTR